MTDMQRHTNPYMSDGAPGGGAFSPYRVHRLLGLQRLGVFYGFHFLFVFPQHPAEQRHRSAQADSNALRDRSQIVWLLRIRLPEVSTLPTNLASPALLTRLKIRFH